MATQTLVSSSNARLRVSGGLWNAGILSQLQLMVAGSHSIFCLVLAAACKIQGWLASLVYLSYYFIVLWSLFCHFSTENLLVQGNVLIPLVFCYLFFF